MSVSAPDLPPHRQRDIAEPMPRCCAHHDDWTVLGDHLCSDFPTVAAGDIVRMLADAQRITEHFKLEREDAIEVGELICRHQLLVATGEIVDSAHVDPQVHRQREAGPISPEV
jgi:hypothetical protein